MNFNLYFTYDLIIHLFNYSVNLYFTNHSATVSTHTPAAGFSTL